MSVDSTKAKCPGQDTMFWKPGDIFDVECAKCGNKVEFFKDEVSRRCGNCGGRVQNPKFSLGCAQWCEHANECLGFDPKERPQGEAGNGSTALADELIVAMKKEFGDDRKRITHALSVFEYAGEILKVEGGNPKVVIAAALLHDIGIQEAERKHGSSAAKYQELEGPSIAARILKRLGFDPASISGITEIVGNHHSAKCADTPEFRIVWDADWIVNIPDEFPGLGKDALAAKIENLFRTETGKEIAARLYLK